MKEIPLLYSTPMIQAKLAGRKTVTRRIIKEAQGWDHNWRAEKIKEEHKDGRQRYEMRCGTQYSLPYFKCRYGQPGDVLYVRENYYQKGYWIMDGLTKHGKRKWKFMPTHPSVLFEENKPTLYEISRNKTYPAKEMWYKRLGRFMPKSAARIWERVISVRTERLQDITPNDAVNEGVEFWNVDYEAFEAGELVADFMNYTWKDDPNYEDYCFPTFANPVDSFRSLWISINGPDSWAINPWVWRLETEVLSTTGRPENL